MKNISWYFDVNDPLEEIGTVLVNACPAIFNKIYLRLDKMDTNLDTTLSNQLYDRHTDTF